MPALGPPPSEVDRYDVVVIGAGAAGLVAATVAAGADGARCWWKKTASRA